MRLACFLVLCSTAAAQLGVPLGFDVALPFGASDPALAVDPAGVVVACYQADGSLVPVSSTSFDGGLTWTAQSGIDVHVARFMKIATDRQGRWVAVWARQSAPEIRAAASLDAGATWSQPIVIPAGLSGDVALTHDGAGSFVAVWSEQAGLLDSDIRTSRSADGVTWSPPAPIDPTLATDTPFDSLPDVDSDGAGRVMAVWNAQGTALTATSIDGGVTWSTPTALATPPPHALDIATDGSRWLIDVGGSLFHQFHVATWSDDFGATWSTPAAVDPLSVIASFVNHVTDGAGNWLGVCTGFSNAATGLLLATRSDDGGATWTPPEPIESITAPVIVAGPPVALGTGRFLVPYHESATPSVRVRSIDLCPLLGPIAPGSGEDFEMTSTVGSLGCPDAGLKIAFPGDTVALDWFSLNATLDLAPTVLLVQPTPTGVLPPSPYPGIRVNPYVAPGVSAFFVNVALPPTGITASFPMPAGLGGHDVLFQSFALAPGAANGIFASSGLHAVRAR